MIFAENHYEVHDKKLLTIVQIFKHWRHYLERANYEMLVLTDHHNFKKFIKTTRLSPRQMRWTQKLSRYNFVIDYRFEMKNSADDLFKRSNHIKASPDQIETDRQILKQLQTFLLRNHDEQKLKRVAAAQVYVDVTQVNELSFSWWMTIVAESVRMSAKL